MPSYKIIAARTKSDPRSVWCWTGARWSTFGEAGRTQRGSGGGFPLARPYGALALRATREQKRAVQLEQIPAPRRRVQAVHVLGHECHARQDALHARKREMPLVRPRATQLPEAPRVEPPHFFGVALEGLGRREVLRAIPLPQAAGPPEGRKAALSRDARSGQDGERATGQKLGEEVEERREGRLAHGISSSRTRRSRPRVLKSSGTDTSASSPLVPGRTTRFRTRRVAVERALAGFGGGSVPEGIPGISVLDVDVTVIAANTGRPVTFASSAWKASRASPRAGRRRRRESSGERASGRSAVSMTPAASVFTRVMRPGAERATVHAASNRKRDVERR